MLALPPMAAKAELCELALKQLAGRTDEGPRDIFISEVAGLQHLVGFFGCALS